ncbi:LuxR family transcriptional regulator [Sphingomonas sp. Root50]|nr:LuxR family transcriptional regulator [Sphingomonas sp. Root1294]KQY72403.1 LuxR family transcriptional regulator [Sphingomonas sp. Root50]KRB94382.1 LuxR family transcriptional regulator [Sphingomonas sp. Root720]
MMNAGDGWSRRMAELAPRILRHDVALLRAPAGYGKSIALDRLRDVLEADGRRCAALVLDKRDADLDRFFRRVSGAVGLDPPAATAAAIAEALEKVSDDRADILFLDGMDEAGEGLPEALSDLILFTPGLRFVIASREAALPGLAKLRAQDRVALIGPDHLSFTREEAIAFLNTGEDADIARLVERCEGWPILLKLVRDGLEAGDPPALAGEMGSLSAGLIADFLDEQILAPLAAEDVDFLERTAVVSRFTLDLARLLAPDASIEKTIERLGRSAGLLQARRLNGLWYHGNAMLRAALMRRLQARVGTDIRQVHRAIETWMIEHDATDEAVLHACLAQDYDECVQLVRRFGPANLSMRYGLRTLRSVLAAFPRHYLDHEPSLGISEALILSKEGRVSDARRLIQRLREAGGGQPVPAGVLGDLDLLDVMLSCHADQPLPTGLAERLSEVASQLPHADMIHQGWVQNLLCRVHLGLGNFANAAAAGLAAERYYAKSDSRYGQFYIHLHLASTRGWQGLYDQVGSHLDSAESIAVQYFPEEPNMAALSRLLRAELLFERGQGDLGIDLLPALLSAENNDGWLDLFVSGYRTAALRAFQDGGLESALAVTRRGEEAAIRTGLPRLSLVMQILRAELLSLAGHRNQAGAALRAIRLGSTGDDDARWRERLALGIANARLLIHSRQFRRATVLLDTLEAECERRGIGRLVLKVGILRAILLACSGSPQRAIASFVELLQSGPLQPSIQAFLEEGELMARLCSLASHHSQRHGLTAEAAQLLADLSVRLGRSYDHVIDQDAGGSYLSGREREILLSLAQGESNKSTAERLNVSEATVKFHLQRIYRKLGAHNRVKAIAVAQQQGLLY